MDPIRGSRRTFVTGLIAGASSLVLGFDPLRRSWVTSAYADGTVLKIPNLDGQLLTDPTTLAAFGDDFGHIVHHVPIAVLEPGSVADVARAVSFCRKHGIQVAMRGQGHSTQGQSQVLAGLVIDSAPLNAIEQVGAGFAIVQAGVIWHNFLAQVEPTGQRPAVITGFTGLSVGGTLSMGGIGPASFRYGAIVDNVLELDVVTGDGVLQTCSPTQNPALFAAVVGGIGQYGIIVRAKIRLVSVASQARNYVITYTDFPTFFGDMNTLVSANQVDGIYSLFGGPAPTPTGFVFQLNVVKYFDPSSPPNDSALLAGLNFAPPQLTTNDMTAFQYDTLVDAQLEALPFGPHVWGDLFLPASQTSSFVQSALAQITPADLAPAGFVGFVLLFPVKNLFPTAVAFRLPNEASVFLFDVLTAGDPSDPNYAATQIPKARARFEAARAIGGTLYPIGSTPMSKADWAQQYGVLYPVLQVAKQTFDPANILTPGPGIF
jgi:FAD/FMN-containing dehydrogenase